MRIDDIARQIDAAVEGDGSLDITGVATLAEASAGQLSFLANAKYAKDLETTGASAVIVAQNVKSDRTTLLKTKDPYYSWCRAVVLLRGHRKHPHESIHPKAHVEKSATVGAGTTIYPGVYVGSNVKIGRDCILYPNAVVYEDCVLGDRVIVHAGACIGNDGFGYATHQGVHNKIPQIGNVIIGDDVEIGANTVIARGALEGTSIGAGTKIDSQVMIGHGAKIGPGCVLVAQVGIAGSATIGKYVTMAGQVGIAGHLNIGDMVTIGAQAGVMFDVEANQTIVGSPAMPAQHARRVYSIFTKLPEVVDRVKHLEEQVQELGGSDE